MSGYQRGQKLPADLIKQAKAMLATGKSEREVGAALGIARSTLYRHKANVRARRIMNDVDRAEIIRQHKEGVPDKDIAAAVGWAKATVYEVLNGRKSNKPPAARRATAAGTAPVSPAISVPAVPIVRSLMRHMSAAEAIHTARIHQTSLPPRDVPSGRAAVKVPSNGPFRIGLHASTMQERGA